MKPTDSRINIVTLFLKGNDVIAPNILH